MISVKELRGILKDLDQPIQDCLRAGCGEPTEFEILTAAALIYFKQKKVDIAVIEAGMGGVIDSTNVITPLVSAITNVRVEHTSYLGTSIREIARNKAGIAKKGVPLICGDSDLVVLDILQEEASRRGAPVLEAGQEVYLERVKNHGLEGFTLDFTTSELAACSVRLSLAGSFQLQNLKTSLAILNQLKKAGWAIESEHIGSGLGKVSWPGRLEKVSDCPEVIIDGAHNPHAARALSQALGEIYPGRHRIMVIGLLDDKEAGDIFPFLADNTRACIVTQPNIKRGRDWRIRAEQARKFFPVVCPIEQVKDAVECALSMVEKDEYVLITGSFYLLDQARIMFTFPY